MSESVSNAGGFLVPMLESSPAPPREWKNVKPEKGTQSDCLLVQIGKSSERASDFHRITQNNGAEPGLEPRTLTPSSVLFPHHTACL